MSRTLKMLLENSHYGIYTEESELKLKEIGEIYKKGETHCMSCTTFEQIHKARRAAELSRTGIKVLVRDGVFYFFPDGHKMPIRSTIDLKAETIAGWLQVLYTIRQERQGKRWKI